MPCEAKNAQVNESKIAILVVDVVELSPRGERASEAGCVTDGGWSLGREVQATKEGPRIRKDQVGWAYEQPDLVKSIPTHIREVGGR